MLQNSFQRAAMAILLIGLMIAPLGMCLQQSPKGAHSCCIHPESPHSLRANCCVFGTQLPATLVAPKQPGASPSHGVDKNAAYVETPSSGERPVVVVIPPLSPPTGAFILRI